MDDGKSGDYKSLIGGSTNSMLTQFTVEQGIIKGRQHRFKYRVKNLIGWSPYSDESFVLAATQPSVPDRPYFLNFDNQQLNIVVPRSTDNGASPITKYELWVDQGDDFTSTFRRLAELDPQTLTYSATIDDALIEGRLYRFKSRAHNQIQKYSEFSIFSYIAFGDTPNTPLSPQRTNATETTISVSWQVPEIASEDLSLTGYILSMDDGYFTDLLPVYIGSNRPDILEFTVSDLTTGLPYRFSVQAVNQNGNSQPSLVSQYYACRLPVHFETPFYISSSQAHIEVGWTAPGYNGGCSILGYHLFIMD